MFLSVWPFRQRRNPSESSRDPAELQDLRVSYELSLLDQGIIRARKRDRTRAVWIASTLAFSMLAIAAILSCFGRISIGLVAVFAPISAICVAMLTSARLPHELRLLDPRSRAPTKSSE